MNLIWIMPAEGEARNLKKPFFPSWKKRLFALIDIGVNPMADGLAQEKKMVTDKGYSKWNTKLEKDRVGFVLAIGSRQWGTQHLPSREADKRQV